VKESQNPENIGKIADNPLDKRQIFRYIFTMPEKIEKKRLAILRALNESDAPLSSPKITEVLNARGHDVSERTVRLYLMELDGEGLTKSYGKRGRMITEMGRDELSSARAFEKIGFLAAKIDQMTYQMDFDLKKHAGTVVMNTSLVAREELSRSIPLIQRVFAAGYAMGELVALFRPGERMGEVSIPDGFVGIGTVCSVTVNGVLLASGIPTISRFGGLLELSDKKPTRFVELIAYEGTTLDPLEVFIRSGMTDYVGATMTGSGRIGASFREMPAGSRERVLELADKLAKVGLGGFMTVGWPGQPLLEIPVSEGRIGAIVIGGLNPVAILEEEGIRVRRPGALAGLLNYEKLFSYRELGERAGEIM
jgi:repressor of nif and glnA expression